MENSVKRNINTILSTFLLIGPILDLLTGISLHYGKGIITIGIIIRMIFLIGIIGIVLFIFKKKKLLIPYFLLGLYFIAYIVGIFLYKGGVGILTEIQNLIKVFYFPIILVSLYSIKEEIHISKLTFFTVLFFYLIFIFVPLVLGIGYKTYEITKEGTLGFFNSANEISGIISILTPILFIILAQSKKWIPKMIVSIMYLVVILMIGTKTPLLTLCLTIGFSIAYYWVYSIQRKNYKQVGASLGIIIIGVIALLMILPHTTFYKNIETHLEFLGLKSIHEVFTKEEYLDHFIFSQRLTFLHNRALTYKASSTYQKLFGIGYLQNGKEAKLIEMDYFDIYYNHGVIGFLLFFGIFLYVLYKILEDKQKITYERYMTEVSVLLIVFLSFFTGHIITTPSVSILCILILLSLTKHPKEILILEKELSKEKENLKKALEEKKYKVSIIQIKNTTKRNYLFFKIVNYRKYHLSISYEKEELDSYAESAASQSIRIVSKKKKETKDLTQKEVIEKISSFL